MILVVSNDMNSSYAQLECYENGKKVFDTIDVNIGENGLAWGLGKVNLPKPSSAILKYEGDKKAPIGIFDLVSIYGYNPHNIYKMPYLYASKNLICVDDSNSPFYNQIIEANGDEKSFEHMRRDDHQYELGVVVAHNADAIDKRGSCIFMHVEKFDKAPTAGCTSMNLEEIKKITSWLDKTKNPILIQIPKSLSKEILKLYPELKKSKLLKD